MSDGQDFRDAPTSIAEARAQRAADSRLWTPRDALVAALRAIDSGEVAPTRLVICVSNPCPGGDSITHTAFWIAGADNQTAIGLMEMCKHDILAGPPHG